MLPILDKMVGLMVLDSSRSGLALSGMAGMSAMEGAGKGTGDDIGGEENRCIETCRHVPLGCSSTFCALWTTFLIN